VKLGSLPLGKWEMLDSHDVLALGECVGEP